MLVQRWATVCDAGPVGEKTSTLHSWNAESTTTKFHCEWLLSILSMNELSSDMYIIAPTLVNIVDL